MLGSIIMLVGWLGGQAQMSNLSDMNIVTGDSLWLEGVLKSCLKAMLTQTRNDRTGRENGHREYASTLTVISQTSITFSSRHASQFDEAGTSVVDDCMSSVIDKSASFVFVFSHATGTYEDLVATRKHDS